MTEQQPDIEIYLKRATLEDIKRWLLQYFEIKASSERGEAVLLDLCYEGQPLECMIIEKVAKGGYVSVWFKSSRTPWETDEACARDAFQGIGVETRCAISGWQAGDDDRENWYRFTDAGQSVVNWLT